MGGSDRIGRMIAWELPFGPSFDWTRGRETASGRLRLHKSVTWRNGSGQKARKYPGEPPSDWLSLAEYRSGQVWDRFARKTSVWCVLYSVPIEDEIPEEPAVWMTVQLSERASRP